jgi:hypothetical protein
VTRTGRIWRNGSQSGIAISNGSRRNGKKTVSKGLYDIVAAIGNYKSLDKAIRESLWNEPEKWLVESTGLFLMHEDGLELVKPVVCNRWVVSRPLGYIRVSWYTHLVINAMIHRETSKKTA